MLTKVEVRTNQGALLVLPLQDISAGYLIKDIQGLDPVRANLVSSSFARLDGEQYQSSRREKRNIVIKLGLEPDYVTKNVRELRSSLYGFFMPKSQVSLRFFTDGAPTVDIVGRVETFDSALFTKDPEVTISLLCFNPDFYTPTPVVINGSTTPGTGMTTIDYVGSVDTGIAFQLNVDRTLSEFSIVHQPSGGLVRTLGFVAPLSAGDVLRISTVSGAKGATLTRSGVQSSILYGISPYADWTTLTPGSNLIRVTAEGAAIPYTIEYTNKYGGL